MNNVLMIKGNLIHFVKSELVEEFENRGWKKVDLTEKETVKKKTKKSN